MENFFVRYKNPLVLMAVLLIQVIALATQVKRPDPKSSHPGSTRLIRVWAVTAITPVERAFIGTGHFFRNTWHNYVDLHGVRKQNSDLQAEVERLRMEQVRLKEDAQQAQRLQALLGFRESFIHQTLAAQVIGTSGSEQSHVIYIDKGSLAGIKQDMAVVAADGIVGKVKDVFPLSSAVLMISDRESGAGVILEKSRLQGILRGSTLGELQVDDIMADEKVEAGEQLITSGGDRIYPKGLPVGTITGAIPDRESYPFLAIKVKPAANLNRLEEVLVITKMSEQSPSAVSENGRGRAAEILAQRLPTVPKTEQKPGVGPQGAIATSPANQKKPSEVGAAPKKKAGSSPDNTASGQSGAEGSTSPDTAMKPKSKKTAGQAKPAENQQPPASNPAKRKKPDTNPQPPAQTETPPQ